MKRPEHIFIFTHALLTAPGNERKRIHDRFKEYYCLNANRKPGVLSIGVQSIHGEETFDAWFTRLAAEPLASLIFFHGDLQFGSIPAHTAAAFAGSTRIFMRVTTPAVAKTFSLASFRSAAYEITASQFAALMDGQAKPSLGWQRTAALVLEANQLNNRTVFERDDIRQYLLTQEGSEVFGGLAGHLIDEIQIEYFINNETFDIPAELLHLFRKNVPPAVPPDEREYVYLYPLKDVSPEEVIALVEAQASPDVIQRIIEQSADRHSFPVTIPSAQWQEQVHGFGRDLLQDFTYFACRVICEWCEEKAIKPIIPEHLNDGFGPSPEEQLRAAARSKMAASRWLLQPTSHPWEYYAFREVDINAPEYVRPLAEAEDAFKDALDKARIFAGERQSHYAQVFALAQFLLQQGGTKWAEEAGIADVRRELETAQFSAGVLRVWDDNAWVGSFLKSLGFDDTSVRGMLAVSIADVFGGMGSWNDQYVDPTQQAEFHERSSRLFKSMQEFFCALLSRWQS